MSLRKYQKDDKQRIAHAWLEGSKNIIYVLPTGGGKTVLFSSIIRDNKGATCVIAHRQELVIQISLALAREKIVHRIIGPKSVIKQAVSMHMSEFGISFYDPQSIHAVAGVDTLVRRMSQLKEWGKTVTLWVQDEAHHLLKENKWGKAISLFPQARGLGVTATPVRADKKPLNVFDILIEGPNMRELIDTEYLSRYRIFAPPNNLDLKNLPRSKTTGDFKPIPLQTAVRKATIIGNVVEHYIRIASGKLGVTFATDIRTAIEIADEFNNCGVPSAVITAKTPVQERVNAIHDFRNNKILQLVNVDIFGEGFDLPALEVVSMARPTMSYALYSQQFGRSLRIIEGKNHAIIIDHVGNVIRHGLPDSFRSWSLEASEGYAKQSSLNPLRSCSQCTAVYEKVKDKCPYCGFKPIYVNRNQPEFVDGNLLEMSPESLAVLRRGVEQSNISIDQYREELINKNVPKLGVLANVKRHAKKQKAQSILRETITRWANDRRSRGYVDSENYKEFFFKFNTDVITAQTLNEKKSYELTRRVADDITGMAEKMGSSRHGYN